MMKVRKKPYKNKGFKDKRKVEKKFFEKINPKMRNLINNYKQKTL